MKQKIYILGLITMLVIFAGVFMKINHLAGAGILISAGIFMLLLIFLPLALYNNYRKEGIRENRLLYAITWITCLVVFGSMLFKIMHWPGAGKLLLLAIPFPFVVFLPVYLFITSKIKNHNIYNTVFMLFLLVYLAVFSALLSLNVSLAKIRQSLVFTDTYKTMTAFMRGDQAGVQRVTDQSILSASDQALKAIEHCRDMLNRYRTSEKENLPADGVSMRMLDSRTLAAKVLLRDEEKSPAADLERKLRNFVQVLKDSTGDEVLAEHAASILMLNTDVNPERSWRSQRFENTYLSWVLVYLESLETNVYLLMQEAAGN